MIGGRGLEVYDIANNQITGATFLDSDEKGPLPLHGGASGSGGPPGERNGQYSHGERADQGRNCGAAEIQRVAENASRWPDIKSLVQPSSTWPSSGSPCVILLWLEALEGPANTSIQNISGPTQGLARRFVDTKAIVPIRVAPAYGRPLPVAGSSVNSASRLWVAGAGTTCCTARRAVARLPFG
jgi:hypothetical protein